MCHWCVLDFTQPRIFFVFSYFPFVGGIGNRDWNSAFPLCNNFALRLCMEESVNSCHSSGMSLIFIAAVRPSTYTQTLSFTFCYEELLEILLEPEKCCHLHCVLQNIQLWSLEDNSSALFFDRWRSLTKSESSFRAILCGSAEITTRKNSVSSAERQLVLTWSLP